MRASRVKVEASGAYSDSVAAGIMHSRAVGFQDSFIALLASYFPPTFQLLSVSSLSLVHDHGDGELLRMRGQDKRLNHVPIAGCESTPG